MARTKKASKEPLLVRSLTVTRSLDTFLQTLSQEASDSLGWTVSKSAILRAMLCLAEQQSSAWLREQILPFIEKEIASERVWGKKKQ